MAQPSSISVNCLPCDRDKLPTLASLAYSMSDLERWKLIMHMPCAWTLSVGHLHALKAVSSLLCLYMENGSRYEACPGQALYTDTEPFARLPRMLRSCYNVLSHFAAEGGPMTSYHPLCLFARMGLLEEVKRDAQRDSSLVNAVDVQRGWTPIMHAACCGHLEVVHYLLDHGANVDYQDAEHAFTALQLACGGGYAKVVEAVLQVGADVTVRNDQGRTALHQAVCSGEVAVVSLLLTHGGCNLNATCHRTTALFEACNRGQTRVMTQLLQAGADPTVGLSPQVAAARWGHEYCVRILQEWDLAYTLSRARRTHDAVITISSPESLADAAPAYLVGRASRALPQVEVKTQMHPRQAHGILRRLTSPVRRQLFPCGGENADEGETGRGEGGTTHNVGQVARGVAAYVLQELKAEMFVELMGVAGMS